MKFLSLQELSQKQKNDVTNLVKICQAYEPVTLSFPLFNEDSFDPSLDCFYLCYMGQKLVSALALTLPEAPICECVAFTDPDYRKQGLFTDLLTQAQANLEKYEEVDLVLLSDHKSKDTNSAFDVLGMEYWYSEFMMALNLSDLDFDQLDINTSLISIREKEFGEGVVDNSIVYHAILDGSPIGLCIVTTYHPSVYLYALEISEPNRRQGYGKAFVHGLLSILAKQQVKKVRLQVSSQNEAAFHLYQQMGFCILEKISYYLA